MSVQAITWAYAQQGLTSAEKFTLVTLSNRADEDWSCYPSIQLISADTSLSEKTVRRSLDDLETKGLIARVRQRNPDGSLGRYRYFLKPPVSMTAGEKAAGNHGVVTVTARKKPQQKQHAVKVTSGENTEQDQHAVTTTAGGPSGHHVPNPSGHHDRSTKPSVLSNRQEEETSNPPVAANALSNAFLEIWNLWPGAGRVRSKSKQLCLEALRRALGNRQPAMMVEAVRRAVKTFDNPKFVPALDRWLRDGKFEHFFPSAEVHELPLSQPGAANDWRAAVRRWADDGYWPSRLGPAPNQVGYRGPLEPLEDLLPELGDHPAAREIRTTINQRQRA